MGLATPSLLNVTRHWAERNHSIESIRANDWLFMTYHAFDYFMNIDDFPRLAEFRQATLDHTLALAETLAPERHYTLFLFAPRPTSGLARLCRRRPLSAASTIWRRRSARTAAGPTSTIWRAGSRSPPSTSWSP